MRPRKSNCSAIYYISLYAIMERKTESSEDKGAECLIVPGVSGGAAGPPPADRGLQEPGPAVVLLLLAVVVGEQDVL